jgi:iron complex transport system substrate-binding protein
MRYLLIFIFLGCTSAQAIEVIDDAGHKIVLTQPAQRIISLAPHATELLFEAGAGNKIIGVVKYSNFPAAAKKIPQVGGYKKLDLERIVSMQPDLIVAWQTGNRESELAKLKSLGFSVFLTEPRHLPDITSLLNRLGLLAGTGQHDDQWRTFNLRCNAFMWAEKCVCRR